MSDNAKSVVGHREAHLSVRATFGQGIAERVSDDNFQQSTRWATMAHACNDGIRGLPERLPGSRNQGSCQFRRRRRSSLRAASEYTQ
jgi:hypothetical protein